MRGTQKSGKRRISGKTGKSTTADAIIACFNGECIYSLLKTINNLKQHQIDWGYQELFLPFGAEPHVAAPIKTGSKTGLPDQLID